MGSRENSGCQAWWPVLHHGAISAAFKAGSGHTQGNAEENINLRPQESVNLGIVRECLS